MGGNGQKHKPKLKVVIHKENQSPVLIDLEDTRMYMRSKRRR
jgi:hypothetical protein